VMRGIDPRDYALLAFGGAGPLHAAEVAEELGMRTVVVPPLPGNFSALGLLLADVRRDYVQTRVSAASNTKAGEVETVLAALIATAAAELAADGFGADRQSFAASLDMRYAGQSFELSVPVTLNPDSMAKIERTFANIYAARYGAATGRAVEIVSYRLAAWGLSEKPQLPRLQPDGRSLAAAVRGTRVVTFGGGERTISVFDRDRLPAAQTVNGPVLVEEGGSTTVVPADWSFSLDAIGCLVMRRS